MTLRELLVKHKIIVGSVLDQEILDYGVIDPLSQYPTEKFMEVLSHMETVWVGKEKLMIRKPRGFNFGDYSIRSKKITLGIPKLDDIMSLGIPLITAEQRSHRAGYMPGRFVSPGIYTREIDHTVISPLKIIKDINKSLKKYKIDDSVISKLQDPKPNLTWRIYDKFRNFFNAKRSFKIAMILYIIFWIIILSLTL